MKIMILFLFFAAAATFSGCKRNRADTEAQQTGQQRSGEGKYVTCGMVFAPQSRNLKSCDLKDIKIAQGQYNVRFPECGAGDLPKIGEVKCDFERNDIVRCTLSPQGALMGRTANTRPLKA